MNSSYFSSGRKDMICTAVGDIAAGDAILAASKGSLSKTLASRKEVDVTEWDEKIAFPTDGWGTALAKVHYLPVRKWTDILRIQEKSTKTANITRCLQDFEKPRLFWLMNTFTRSSLTKINVGVKKLITCNV